MPAAQNSRRQYAFIAETVFGTTPATPQTQLIEVTDFGLEVKTQTLSDPSIRADRQVGYARRGNLGVEGSLNVVMCPSNYDSFLEALLGGTWTTNVLKVGTTSRSFTFEEGLLDLNQFRSFTGVVMNSMSLNITPDKLVEASFSTMGQAASAFSGTSLDTTPTAITSQAKFFHESGVIKEGGTTVGYVTALKIDATNNFKGDYALSSTSYRALTPGKFEVTGELTALVEDVTLYNKFKNSTSSSIEVTLVDGTGKSHTYKMAKITYLEGALQRASDGPIFVNLKFQGLYDATDASSFSITRV